MTDRTVKAEQIASQAVRQAVADEREKGVPIDGPQLIISVLNELTVEDLLELAMHTFVTHRLDDLPEGDVALQEGALRDLIAREFDRGRLGDEALAWKYVKLTVKPLVDIIGRLLDEHDDSTEQP